MLKQHVWKFQHVLKTVTHVESYVKISRCVENVYVRHVENHIENHVEVRKKHHHTLQHVLKLSGRFRFFSLRFCTHKQSETYTCERLSVMHQPARLPENFDQILQNTPVLEFGSRTPSPKSWVQVWAYPEHPHPPKWKTLTFLRSNLSLPRTPPPS